MSYNTAQEKQLWQYLLGKLPEHEQQQIEEQLMTQDNLFEQLEVFEDELIDEYLRDTLTHKDREDFEKHFLSAPERRQKLRFAEAFRSYVAIANEGTEKEHSKASFWQTLWAALRTPTLVLRYGVPMVLLGGLIGGLRMAGTIQRLHTEVAQVRTEQGSLQEKEQQLQQQLEAQRRHSEELEQQLVLAQAPSQKPALSALLFVTLRPGVLRDSGTSNRLLISSDTRLVEVRLELGENKYKNYRVLLQDSAGSEVFILNKTKPKRLGSNQFIVLTLPADAIPSDDYSLKLSGESSVGEFDPLGSYSLAVRRR